MSTPVTPEARGLAWFGAGALARNTVRVLFWQVLRMAVQLVWVVAIARLLGAEGYGVFAGVSGFAIAVGAFAGLGLGLLMYQETAREPASFGPRWGQAHLAIWISGIGLALMFIPVAIVLFGTAATSVLVAIAIAELVFVPLVATSAFAFAAHERMGWSAALPVTLGVARLLAVAAFASWGGASLADYAWFHAIASAMAGLLSVWLVHRLLRPGRATGHISVADLRKGAGFSASWASTSALTSLDKTVVLQLGGDTMAGQYASAYRFVTLVTLPVEALTMAALPRLFRDAKAGVAHPALVPAMAACVGLYGIVAGAAVWWLADWLVVLLGNSFDAAVGAVRGLAFFLPFYALRVLAMNLLLAMDRKRDKVVLETCGLVAMLVLGGALIPTHGLLGAVEMIVAVEVGLAALAWLRVAAARKKEAHGTG